MEWRLQCAQVQIVYLLACYRCQHLWIPFVLSAFDDTIHSVWYGFSLAYLPYSFESAFREASRSRNGFHFQLKHFNPMKPESAKKVQFRWRKIVKSMLDSESIYNFYEWFGYDTYLVRCPMDIDVPVPFYCPSEQNRCYQQRRMEHGCSSMYSPRKRIHRRWEIDRYEHHWMRALEWFSIWIVGVRSSKSCQLLRWLVWYWLWCPASSCTPNPMILDRDRLDR